MRELVNRRIVLAARPCGRPTLDNFHLVSEPVPGLADGQLLQRLHMRERVRDGAIRIGRAGEHENSARGCHKPQGTSV